MRTSAREYPDVGLVELRELARHDLVGWARCTALDADSFPYPSIPLGLPPGLQTLVAVRAASSGSGSGIGGSTVGFLTSTARSGPRYIHGLAVAADARRRGIGRALLRACIEGARAAGARSIALHVGVSNGHAAALYDAEGFEIRRVLRDFYRPGVYPNRAAYEMVLDLP